MSNKIKTSEDRKEKFNFLYNKINALVKGQNVRLTKDVLKSILSGVDLNSTID